jgi:hypothetical protein
MKLAAGATFRSGGNIPFERPRGPGNRSRCQFLCLGRCPEPEELQFWSEDERVSITIDPATGGRTLAGSDHQPFTETLFDAVLATIRTSTSDPKAATNRIATAATALAAFKPTDEIEAMLGAQAIEPKD